MNRFVKKNIVLIGVLCGSAVFALGLLIYAVIALIDFNHYLSRTEKARDTIKKLVKQKPAPGEENEKRIQEDIELYKKSTQGLLARFKSPLQAAIDAFIAELPPPQLTGEEAEPYKVPGTGETDENGKITKPLKIRKLTENELKTLLKSRYDQYTADMSEEIKNGIDAQTSFVEDFSRLFPSGENGSASWNSAVRCFVTKAKTLTAEPIDQSNQTALLLNALGFSRRVNSSGMRFMEHLSKYAETLTQLAGAMELSSQATDFLISPNTAGSSLQLPPRDMAQVLFHWDVYGDIIKRLSAAKIKQVLRIYVRKYAVGEGEKLGTMFEQIGSYKLYHYTLEVSGSMESFRNAVKELDEASNENRTYIVRAVYLYDDGDAAGALMGRGQSLNTQTENNTPDNPDELRLTRRRRRRRNEPVVSRPEENSEEKNKKEMRERILAAEAKLPINERSGYGAILIGGQESFRAFIDIDYVVLEQEQ